MQIETTTDELRGLLHLLQRTPLTQVEALFIEMLFTRWLPPLAADDGPGATDPPAANDATDVLSAADAPIGAQNQPQPIGTSDQPGEALPAGAPSTNDTDQVQSTQND